MSISRSQKVMWHLYCVLLVTWCWLWLMSGGVTGHWVFSTWRRLPLEQSAVSGYQTTVKVRSKVECVKECNKLIHCSSFVFNATSHICYLQPTLDVNDTRAKHLGKAYVNEDYPCADRDPPSVNGTISTWIRSQTSLRGEVTCPEGYINTTDNWVQCTTNNTWESEVRCSQYLWTDPPLSMFPVAIPLLPVVAGWSVCLEGTHSANTRFTVDLWITENNRAFVIDFRFYAQTVVLVTMRNGIWGPETVPSVFAFVRNQPFYVRIKVTDNGYFEVKANSTTYKYAVNSLLPVANITSVYVWNDVTLTDLNLMCSL